MSNCIFLFCFCGNNKYYKLLKISSKSGIWFKKYDYLNDTETKIRNQSNDTVYFVLYINKTCIPDIRPYLLDCIIILGKKTNKKRKHPKVSKFGKYQISMGVKTGKTNTCWELKQKRFSSTLCTPL